MRRPRVPRLMLSLCVLSLVSMLQPGQAGRGAAASAGVAAGWLDAARQRIEQSEYEVSWQTGTQLRDVPSAWHAPNRAQGFRTYFTGEGIRVIPRTEEDPSWEWALTFLGHGRRGARHEAEPAVAWHDGNRVEYDRGSVVEWYENSPRGLEQGFTILERPAKGEGALFVSMSLGGSLSPLVSEDGQAIDFVTPLGALALVYADLKATDAAGTTLKARMEGFNEEGVSGIRIVVEDGGAIYPVTIDPLTTNPIWTADGGQAGALFGSSVATAGDVNGDRFSDVIIGAFHFDNGEADEGRAYVFMGSTSGPAPTPAWIAEGDQDGAEFGSFVSTAGDVNGDGYSDVIVGARYFDNGQEDEGRAYVYLGSAAGLSSSPAWTAEPDQAGAMFGVSVSTAGDVNGDGYSDVAVGARYFDNGETDEGGVFVYLGSASGPTALPDWRAEGGQDFALLGNSVALAGDVNGDGYADLIAGADGYDNGELNEGRAYVYHGSATGLGAAPAWMAEGNQEHANFGWNVATAGDRDGDGYADVIVGAPNFDNGEADEGRAFVYHGSQWGLPAAPEWTAESEQAGANFGWAVATAGDVNGDGYAEVIVGAYLFDNGEADEGRAWLYLGSRSGLGSIADWVAEGDQAAAHFGMAVATAGDVNGDGFADVIVSARSYDNTTTGEGRAWVYRGSADGASLAYQFSGHPWERLGYSVAAGDYNNDGFSDLIIGAPFYDEGQNGCVYLYLGAEFTRLGPPDESWFGGWHSMFGASVAPAGDVDGDGSPHVIVGAPLGSEGTFEEGVAYDTGSSWKARSHQTGSRFGASVAGAGDVNGDGFPDVIVGAPDFTNGQAGEGRAYLYLGSAAGLAASPAWTAEGDQTGAAFGASVAPAGDVNGDGYSDVLVGAPGADNGQVDEGRAYLYMGSAMGLAGGPAWIAWGGQAGARFGASVATAGDVNRDAYSDIIVGAPDYGNGQSMEGRAFVYLGSPSGLAAAPAWSAEGDQDLARFGASVATAGDVNGDGYSEVIVGAPYFTNSETQEGRAYLYLGRATGPAAAPAWTADGGLANSQFGASVSTAGDYNGDGYSDLIIGAPTLADYVGKVSLFSGSGDSGGAPLCLQQLKTNGEPLGPLSWSDAEDSFGMSVWAGATPFGRGKVRAMWEVKPVGVPFSATGMQEQPSWWDTSTPAILTNLATGLAPGVPYHWRIRLKYDPVSLPFLPRGRWLSGWWNGTDETDLRTFWSADAAVTISDTPDPVIVGGPDLAYTIEVRNDGPGVAATGFVQALPPEVSLVSVTPSQGSCSLSGSTLTCALGDIDLGEVVTVQELLRPEAQATLVSAVDLRMPASDPNPTDNSAMVETESLMPAAGDRIWLDADGDGIQEAGEPGFSGAAVGVYESATGAPVDGALSDVTGFYELTALTYGGSYYLVFFPPLAYVLTALDQGGDDTLDSDADPATWRTPDFTFTNLADFSRWDAGVYPRCLVPDQQIDLDMVTLSTDGSGNAVLHFIDANQASQVTGYNVYCADGASLAHASWPMVAADVTDMDPASPDTQWIDTASGPPVSVIWYYSVTACNHRCPAEGPW